MMMKVVENNMDIPAFIKLREAFGFMPYPRQEVEAALRNSLYCVHIERNGKTILPGDAVPPALIQPFQIVVNEFKNTLSRAGFIILILGGYTHYMNHIGANAVTVHSLTKPLKKVKSVYLMVPFVFLLGNLLSLVIPSASNLAIILLATLFPVLKGAGMSTLTAAGIIATTATVMSTPLGGDNVAIATEFAKHAEFAGLTVTDYVFNHHALVSVPTLLVMAIAHYFWQKYSDRHDLKKAQQVGIHPLCFL